MDNGGYAFIQLSSSGKCRQGTWFSGTLEKWLGRMEKATYTVDFSSYEKW